MKRFIKTLGAAGLAAGALIAATPAAAQVQGQMATADISRAILGTTALQTAYNQVGTTYAAQIEQRATKQQQLTQLLQPFDSNGDGQLAESELAGVQQSPSFSQIQTLEQEIAGLNNQVNAARVYAVEQIFAQYPAALTEVAQAQNVAIVFQPDMLQYAAQGADITGAITTSLNAKVPSVEIVPPANYRPNQNAAQIFQEIQQTLLRAQIIQQQQAAQQGQQQAAPAGR
ncbi:OmpH family outer membrane protein [Qipengyuania sp. S6317L1]|uniref:OmpH family outer membrane protein n=1 Tax=Qipengyuania sp. S6317L1 TaxID=2926410 RepID=UPI001FF1F4F5|nr:OmpH family outer membrane protein [Qipengyuania sp. S6317L1]MCK0100367.1 OmpH family outer membrane protein [Qipengyuania sp. S6317L1]